MRLAHGVPSLRTLLRSVPHIFCAVTGMFAKITIVTVGAVRVNEIMLATKIFCTRIIIIIYLLY